MKKVLSLLVVAVVATLLVLAGCEAAAHETPSGRPEVELRTYSVPHGYQAELRSMLRTTLGTDSDRIGRASIAPGGMLVVVAPATIHKGIRELVDELNALDTPPATPEPVSLNYWLVVGKPVARGTDRPYSVKGPANLDVIGEALEEIALSEGAMEFQLIERLRLISMGDGEARVQGSNADVRQRATVVQGKIVANIRISTRPDHNLNTMIKLEPEQFVVLGNSGYSGLIPGSDSRAPEEGLTLYYVITAEKI